MLRCVLGLRGRRRGACCGRFGFISEADEAGLVGWQGGSGDRAEGDAVNHAAGDEGSYRCMVGPLSVLDVANMQAKARRPATVLEI